MTELDYKKMGLFERYRVERSDGAPLDEGEAHLTLRYDKDSLWCAAVRRTLRQFASEVREIGYEAFASDLEARLNQAEECIRRNNQPSSRQPSSRSAS